MKIVLSAVESKLYHYKNGNKISGPNPNMHGNCSGLHGDCSGLHGNCTSLHGDCSDLRGDCSGLIGDCSGLIGDCTCLRGNLDDAEITDRERKNCVNIRDLIKEVEE